MNGKQARRIRREARKQATAPNVKRGGRWLDGSQWWWYRKIKRAVSHKVIPPLPKADKPDKTVVGTVYDKHIHAQETEPK